MVTHFATTEAIHSLAIVLRVVAGWGLYARAA